MLEVFVCILLQLLRICLSGSIYRDRKLVIYILYLCNPIYDVDYL